MPVISGVKISADVVTLSDLRSFVVLCDLAKLPPETLLWGRSRLNGRLRQLSAEGTVEGGVGATD